MATGPLRSHSARPHREFRELAHIQVLMSRYADRPMDFADATLVYLAKREGLSTIFTVDHNDFETYRIHGRRRFRVLPTSRPARFGPRS